MKLYREADDDDTSGDRLPGESSSQTYYRQLYEGIRDGSIIDPDLWLNPETNEVELRPTRLEGVELADARRKNISSR